MKDPHIESLVDNLKIHVGEVNRLMKELEGLNVVVRISYTEPSKSKEQSQGINLWHIQENNNYL
jgi:hypothetical protein